MPCRFLDLLSHIIVTVKVKDISDEVESILIILDIRIEPSKVEAIREIVFINLAEIFVTSRRDELHGDLSASIRFDWYLIDNTRAKP